MRAQDALADMRLTERMLLHAYADAAGRGTNSLRQTLAELFAEAAEDVQTVLSAAEGDPAQEERPFAESPLRAVRAGKEKAQSLRPAKRVGFSFRRKGQASLPAERADPVPRKKSDVGRSGRKRGSARFSFFTAVLALFDRSCYIFRRRTFLPIHCTFS